VGHAGLDRMRTTRQISRAELAQELGLKSIDDRYLVIVQHPLSSEKDEALTQMRETLAAAQATGWQTFVSYPNSDPRSQQIIQAINEYSSQPGFHVFQNIADEAFVNLLRGAALLLGNSSLGLLEAPYLGLPVINVGRRQASRHHAQNVFFAPNDRDSILRQLRAVWESDDMRKQARECDNPFGDGHTGQRVAELLAATPIAERLLNKDLSY